MLKCPIPIPTQECIDQQVMQDLANLANTCAKLKPGVRYKIQCRSKISTVQPKASGTSQDWKKAHRVRRNAAECGFRQLA